MVYYARAERGNGGGDDGSCVCAVAKLAARSMLTLLILVEFRNKGICEWTRFCQLFWYDNQILLLSLSQIYAIDMF